MSLPKGLQCALHLPPLSPLISSPENLLPGAPKRHELVSEKTCIGITGLKKFQATARGLE